MKLRDHITAQVDFAKEQRRRDRVRVDMPVSMVWSEKKPQGGLPVYMPNSFGCVSYRCTITKESCGKRWRSHSSGSSQWGKSHCNDCPLGERHAKGLDWEPEVSRYRLVGEAPSKPNAPRAVLIRCDCGKERTLSALEWNSKPPLSCFSCHSDRVRKKRHGAMVPHRKPRQSRDDAVKAAKMINELERRRKDG